jgi:hypothetical protein
MTTRATLNFVMEWDNDELDITDPRELLLEILADQPDKDLYNLIVVEDSVDPGPTRTKLMWYWMRLLGGKDEIGPRPWK